MLWLVRPSLGLGRRPADPRARHAHTLPLVQGGLRRRGARKLAERGLRGATAPGPAGAGIEASSSRCLCGACKAASTA
eukprot:scaffold116278_cov32-Tisochrysis_lutea.AAC.6